MPLAKLAIKQPIFISMILLAVVLIGVIMYLEMGVELYPDTSNPSVSISVSYPGASPSDVQRQVTQRIERAVATINGVNSIMSNSSLGSSNVTINFNVGYNIQQGSMDVRQAMDAVQRSLPSGANPPVMRRFDPNSAPFMTAGMNVGGNIAPDDLVQLIQDVIEPRLSQIEGIAAASVSGYPTTQINVDLNITKLKAYHITATQVINALKAQNVSMPSGSIINSMQNIPVQTAASFQNLDEINKIIVAQYGTRIVRLSDVATVGPTVVQTTNIVRVNGQQTLMVQFQIQSGGNVVKAAQLAKDELNTISRDFRQIKFTILQDNSTFIKQSDNDVMLTLIIGAILAALIVMLFMRDFRNTIITVAGLPIIILGTFAVINLLGFTLNIITLMALSLSIGLLIDDAIVVRENIFRHMEHGASPKEAADKGTGEIAFAVIAISLTLVAVFIPVAFTSGAVGRLFKEFGITVAVAVLISLFEAFTFAPLLTAYFAKPMKLHSFTGNESKKRSVIDRLHVWQSTVSGYRAVLAWSLQYRIVIILISIGLFGASIFVLRGMPITFFPTTDQGQISININLPPATALEQTNKVAQQVEAALARQPEVKLYNSRINANSGNISVQLAPGVKTDDVIARLRKSLNSLGNQISFNKPNQFLGIGFGMGVFGRPVQISIQGPVASDVLTGVAQQVVDRISTVPGIRDAALNIAQQSPELDIIVDRQRAEDAGISASSLGSTVAALVQGSTATQIQWQGKLTDVDVQLRAADISDPSSLNDLPIAGSNGTLYPLGALATIKPGTGPTRLSRQNQQAIVSVGANLEGRGQGDVAVDIQKALSDLQLPVGVTWKFAGQMAQAQSAYSSLIYVLLLGLVFVYMVLASQFGSLIHPFTVMVALPLAIVGCVAAMLVTHTQLSVISLIGVILMMGMATKNSILIVDFIIRYRKQGMSRTEAVLEAGPVRLRPIIMTSLAIILGMMPTAVAFGASGAFRAPMAIAVIGGTITSTALSLLAVPVVYTLFDDASVWVLYPFRRKPKIVVPFSSGPSKDNLENGNLETHADTLVQARKGRRWFRSHH
jgi:HAE1 family hydrophobic/amphiphilic exporter-1